APGLGLGGAAAAAAADARAARGDPPVPRAAAAQGRPGRRRGGPAAPEPAGSLVALPPAARERQGPALAARHPDRPGAAVTDTELRRFPIFAGLATEELAAVAAQLEPSELAPERPLWREGESATGLVLLESGALRFESFSDGALGERAAPACLGIASLVAAGGRGTSPFAPPPLRRLCPPPPAFPPPPPAAPPPAA